MDIVEIKSIGGVEKTLSDLLIDSVNGGASVGFITPIDAHDIEAYWQEVEQGLQSHERRLFVAFDGDGIVGCVQLSLCAKANGLHRGEVEKLMVLSAARGKGIAKLLMATIEQTAKDMGLLLLILDTREGDVASDLYRRLNYIEAGKIPQFARSSDGQLAATVYFYKLIE